MEQAEQWKEYLDHKEVRRRRFVLSPGQYGCGFMSKFKFPTEEIELPSQGYLYPETSPLSSGKIEMKYMTTREEDILTNQNYIKQGIVLDKLLQSMIVTPINYDELLAGDKDGIMLAARILGYGAEYSFEYFGQMKQSKQSLNLQHLKHMKPFGHFLHKMLLKHMRRFLHLKYMKMLQNMKLLKNLQLRLNL